MVVPFPVQGSASALIGAWFCSLQGAHGCSVLLGGAPSPLVSAPEGAAHVCCSVASARQLPTRTGSPDSSYFILSYLSPLYSKPVLFVPT